ncbi:MAG: FAD-dependent oxidoreductase [Mycoplasmatales bacterium]
MYNYDLVVIGGGTAGIAAALSSAMKGFRVCIIEKQITLSGTQANGLVTPFMPSGHQKYEVTDLILKNYLKYDLDKSNVFVETIFCFNPEIFALSVEQLLNEYKIDVFYDTSVFEIIMEEKKIKKVKSIFLDKIIEISGDNFVDASGNALVCNLLNQEVNKGDEKGKNQSVSLRFEIANINFKKLKFFLKEQKYTFCPLNVDFLEFVNVPNVASCGGLNKIFEKGISNNEISFDDARYVQGFSTPSTNGVLSFNGPQIPNIYDLFDPLEYQKIIQKGHLMQYRLHKFFKKTIPGFEESFISKTASQLGIRESSRIIGNYILNEKDYLNRQTFKDGVVRGDWYIDIHDDSLDVENESFKSKYNIGEFYEIPYRSLIKKEISNCIFVGRHISTTFKMQSSVRIQHTCYGMGNVVGFALLESKKGKIDLNKVDGSKIKKAIEVYYEK